MSVTSSGLFSERMKPAAIHHYGIAKNKITPFSQILIGRTMVSDKAYEEIVSEAGVGISSLKGEGEAIVSDSVGQGFVQSIKPLTWAKALPMTFELLDDDYSKDEKLAQLIGKDLARADASAFEVVAHSILNEGFSTVAGMSALMYRNPDGVALFSSSHPYEKGTGTFANVLSTTIEMSEFALESMVIMCRQMKDGTGIHRDPIEPRTILVPPELEFKTKRIMNSAGRAGTANNDTNVIGGMGINVKVSPYLSSSTAYFLLTSANDENGIIVVRRKEPDFHMYVEDTTHNKVSQVISRFGIGYSNPRAVIGAQGS